MDEAASPDHRSHYSPAAFYAASQRMSEGWTVEDVVEAYMRLHPDADLALVEGEIRTIADGEDVGPPELLYSKAGHPDAWSRSYYFCERLGDSLFKLEAVLSNPSPEWLRYGPAISQTIREPQEVWRHGIRYLAYLASWKVEGETVHIAAIFQTDDEYQAWAGWRTVISRDQEDIVRQRLGKLVWSAAR